MKEEIFNKQAKTINNSMIKNITKEKDKANFGNYETKEDQNKEAKKEDVRMIVDEHSETDTNE